MIACDIVWIYFIKAGVTNILKWGHVQIIHTTILYEINYIQNDNKIQSKRNGSKSA